MTKGIQPPDVGLDKFVVTKDNVLYSDDHYAIAISTFYRDDFKRLGLRWQTSGPGFPAGAWMMLPQEIEVPILEHLLKTREDDEHFSHQKTKEAIETLQERKKLKGF